MIFTTSRYNDGPLVDIEDYRESEVRKTVYRKWPTSVSDFSVYVWQDGDRMDLIALKFYGRPEVWWQIMDYNPEIVDPTSIQTGTEIRLPS